MKKFLLFAAFAAMILASCQNYDEEIDSLQKQLDDIKTASVKTNTNIESLQKIVDSIKKDDKVESITPIQENGTITGYTIKFKDSGSVTVYNQSSAITVGEENGTYYWKVGNDWLKDSKGERVSVIGATVEPQFKVENNSLMFSVDNGSTWSNAGSLSTSLIESVTEDAEAVRMTIAGGQVITLPKVQNLTIEFTGDIHGPNAGKSVTVSYKVSGTSNDVFVGTHTQAGWKAVVDAVSATTGTITVTAPDPITDYPVIVLVSDNTGRAVVTAIPFEEPIPGSEEETVLTALQTAYEVAAEGGEISVKISTNVDYDITVSENWISRKETKAVREDEITFTVNANTSTDSRSATITFAKDNYSTSVTVVQSGKEISEEPVLTVDSAEFEVEAEGGEVVVTVTSNVDYVTTISEDWVHELTTKAVSENQLTFIVDENTSSEARTATITFEKDECYASVSIIQSGANTTKPYSHDLSANGIANCYIVIEAGDDYSFDCKYFGNGQDGILDCEDDPDGVEFHTTNASISSIGKPAVADIIWQKDADNQNTLTMITDVQYDKDNKRISFKTDGTKGNAIIGIYDKYDTLLWSWHIWCTDMPQDIKYSSSCFEVDYYVMDRNLGAVSCNPADGKKTFGAHYQWGRKDPFMLKINWRDEMIDNPTNTLESAIQMPDKAFRGENKPNDWMQNSTPKVNHYLWGNSAFNEILETAETYKTIYDPCPAGYQVPSTDVFQDLSRDEIEAVGTGFLINAENGQKLFMPYSGIGDRGDNAHTYDGWYAYYGEPASQVGMSDSINHGVHAFSCWFNCSAYTFTTTAAGSCVGGAGMCIDTDIIPAYTKGNDIEVHISPNFINYWDVGFAGYLRTTLRSVRCVKTPTKE